MVVIAIVDYGKAQRRGLVDDGFALQLKRAGEVEYMPRQTYRPPLVQ